MRAEPRDRSGKKRRHPGPRRRRHPTAAEIDERVRSDLRKYEDEYRARCTKS